MASITSKQIERDKNPASTTSKYMERNGIQIHH
jgi:hypothetical protein